MKLKMLLCGALMGAVMIHGAAVFASEGSAEPAVFETADGVLSIEAPTSQWNVVTDPNYWFVLSDGDDVITISHLSNGESLPTPQVADSSYAAVYHAFVSTKNEVFVVRGCAVEQDSLSEIMQAIGTIKVLKLDTKQALKQGQDVYVSQFSLRPINATYYSTSDSLRVRSGCSTDDEIFGYLGYGEAVTVIGAVQKDGEDYGWYQIQFNGSTAYASAQWLSGSKPEKASSEEKSETKDSDSGSGYSSEDAFSIYTEDGSFINISPVKGGDFVDHKGRRYTNTRDDIYYCVDTGIIYVGDPSSYHWEDGEPRLNGGHEQDTYYDNGETGYEHEQDTYYDNGETGYEHEQDTYYDNGETGYEHEQDTYYDNGEEYNYYGEDEEY